MTKRTSIPCTKETRDLLADLKGGESWDDFLQALAKGGDSDDVRRILNRLDDLENTVPEKTARSLETRFR